MAMTAGREGSDLIARQTGGFMIRNSNDFGLKRVAEDQNGYYLIGYQAHGRDVQSKVPPSQGDRERPWPRALRTREGFFGIGEESTEVQELNAGGSTEEGAHVSVRLQRYHRAAHHDVHQL